MYKCGLCDTVFDTRYDYKLHQSVLHSLSNGDKEIRAILQGQQKLLEKISQNQRKIMPWVGRKRKKFNCLDYLKNHYGRVETNYSEFCNNIKVLPEHFQEVLTDHPLEYCIMQIIESNLSTYNEELPIRCFDLKRKNFYVYENDWRQMTEKEFNKLFGKCSARLHEYFKEWRDENDDENGMTTYTSQMRRKMLGGGVGKMKSIRNKVKNKLFHYLKVSEKNIFEIEFE